VKKIDFVILCSSPNRPVVGLVIYKRLRWARYAKFERKTEEMEENI
jgi:hypothetical protein